MELSLHSDGSLPRSSFLDLNLEADDDSQGTEASSGYIKFTGPAKNLHPIRVFQELCSLLHRSQILTNEIKDGIIVKYINEEEKGHLLLKKTLGGIPVHPTLEKKRDNTRTEKWLIHNVPIVVSKEELKISAKCLSARRVCKWTGDQWKETATVILTYPKNTAPSCVKIGYLTRPLRYFPEKPPRCYRCQEEGHMIRNCNRPAKCKSCGGSHVTWKCSEMLASSGNVDQFKDRPKQEANMVCGHDERKGLPFSQSVKNVDIVSELQIAHDQSADFTLNNTNKGFAYKDKEIMTNDAEEKESMGVGSMKESKFNIIDKELCGIPRNQVKTSSSTTALNKTLYEDNGQFNSHKKISLLPRKLMRQYTLWKKNHQWSVIQLKRIRDQSTKVSSELFLSATK